MELLLRRPMFACISQINKLLHSEKLVFTPHLSVIYEMRNLIALAPLLHAYMKADYCPLLLCSDSNTHGGGSLYASMVIHDPVKTSFLAHYSDSLKHIFLANNPLKLGNQAIDVSLLGCTLSTEFINESNRVSGGSLRALIYLRLKRYFLVSGGCVGNPVL